MFCIYVTKNILISKSQWNILFQEIKIGSPHKCAMFCFYSTLTLTFYPARQYAEIYKKFVCKGRGQQKKNFFRALPEFPNPPPPWPQFGQLGPLFSDVKIQDLKVSLELKILYMLYNILYICNLKNS